MRMSYDPDADAAYVYLVDEIGARGVDRTVPVDPSEVGGMINLDFDAEGRLSGKTGPRWTGRVETYDRP